VDLKAVMLGRTVVVVADNKTNSLRYAEIQVTRSGHAKLAERSRCQGPATHALLVAEYAIGTHGNTASGERAESGFLPCPAIEIARGIRNEGETYGSVWLYLLPINEVLRISTVGKGHPKTDYYLFNGSMILHRSRDQRKAGDDLPGHPYPQLNTSLAFSTVLVEGEKLIRLSSSNQSVVGSNEDWDQVSRAMLERTDFDGPISFDVGEDGNGYLYNPETDEDDELWVQRPGQVATLIRDRLNLTPVTLPTPDCSTSDSVEV
jgi:uncharacterized membrane protein